MLEIVGSTPSSSTFWPRGGMADTLVLGTSSSECRFESCRGYYEYYAIVVKLVDTLARGASAFRSLWVRVPSIALYWRISEWLANCLEHSCPEIWVAGSIPVSSALF